jgi:pimeloyl-ACP methyl ester carboxylesterase
MPLVVIARGRPVALPTDEPPGFSARLEQAWRRVQQQRADLVPGGELVVAKQASHYVQFDQPAIVVNAVQRVVDRVRHR